MTHTLDLNGSWLVRWTDGERGGRRHYAQRDTIDTARYIPAQVPGEAHLDMWKAGWISDPYVDMNCLAARWIETCYWSYRREFEVPAEALDGARAWLNFEGLDYFAVIMLNGVEVGRHENTFYPCRVEITGKLKSGRNLLVVHLEGGLFGASDKPSTGFTPDHVITREIISKRHWLRKPQCQFNWDWSTRLINVGIFKPVTLEWSRDAVRLDQLVPLATVSPDLQEGQLKVRWFAEGLKPGETPATLVVEILAAGVNVRTPVTVKTGLNPLEANVTVPHPKLWWPVGHGSPDRYEVKVTLEIEGTVIDQRTVHVGFRRVVINQDPHPQSGRYFIVEINNRKIFAKGSNFVPADMIFTRTDRARYATLIDRALEANFNLLRVWGGGLYESDDFYDLCDERGVLVWQEFIFACGKYPATDEGFFNNVKKEAVYNIRRLASHPSLVIWCGNNEMEWGAWHWGYDQGVVHPDHALFHITLPRLLAQEDGTRYYQPSSPYSPDGKDPVADDSGDQHPWSVCLGQPDFRDYRKMICRFPNEGGTIGPVSLPTMLACLPEGHRYPQSPAWQVHDNGWDSWEEPSPPDQLFRFWLGVEPRKLSIEAFTYWAGLIQAEGLREYCENFRRRMFDSAAAIFWMFNDCWPTTRSWTIVDYYLRRTPSFYPVQRAMAPVHVVVVEEGDQVLFFGVNDTQETIRGELRHGIFSLNGAYIKDATISVELKPNASTRLASIPSSEWTERASTMPFAMLLQNGKLVARSRTFGPLFHEIAWPETQVQVSVRDGQAIFTSEKFAWNVCIDLDGEKKLADNFFDLYPSIPYSIPWAESEPPQVRFVGNQLPELMRQSPGPLLPPSKDLVVS